MIGSAVKNRAQSQKKNAKLHNLLQRHVDARHGVREVQLWIVGERRNASRKNQFKLSVNNLNQSQSPKKNAKHQSLLLIAGVIEVQRSTAGETTNASSRSQLARQLNLSQKNLSRNAKPQCLYVKQHQLLCVKQLQSPYVDQSGVINILRENVMTLTVVNVIKQTKDAAMMLVREVNTIHGREAASLQDGASNGEVMLVNANQLNNHASNEFNSD